MEVYKHGIARFHVIVNCRLSKKNPTFSVSTSNINYCVVFARVWLPSWRPLVTWSRSWTLSTLITTPGKWCSSWRESFSLLTRKWRKLYSRWDGSFILLYCSRTCASKGFFKLLQVYYNHILWMINVIYLMKEVQRIWCVNYAQEGWCLKDLPLHVAIPST